MSEDEPRDGGVLSGLPRSRPQRRSERRTTAPAPDTPQARRTAATKAKAARASAPKPKAATAKPKPKPKPRPATTAAQSTSAPPRARRRPAPLDQPRQPPGSPPPPDAASEERRTERGPAGVLGTAAQAAGELGSIGVTIGKQIVKGALGRIPRP